MKYTKITHVMLLAFCGAAGAALAQQQSATPPPGLPPELAVKLLQQQKKPPVSATPQAAPAPTAAAAEASAAAKRDKWDAFMARYYDIKKYPKKMAVRISATVARPLKHSDIKMEIVDEDDEYFYMRNLPIEDPDSLAHSAWMAMQTLEARSVVRTELAKTRFVLDPHVEHPAPLFTDRVHLDERSGGLPSKGRWQMGLATGDFNKDGLVDLVLPPARMGPKLPWVVLQTPTGWQRWEGVMWPETKLDYGDVGVADFDGDGNLDIAIACHFLPAYVLYGDGKGDFRRFVELPRANPNITSRAMVVADFDGDGRQDVATLAELDLSLSTNVPYTNGLLQVSLNTKDGWRAVDVSKGAKSMFGDRLASGDFDGDGKPDLLVSSHSNQNANLVYLNDGAGKFTAVTSDEFPYLGYIFGVAAGRLDDSKRDTIVMGMFQNVRGDTGVKPINGVLLYTVDRGEPFDVSRRYVASDGRELDNYTCATVADVDGDGRQDVVVGRRQGGVQIYLQGPDGQLMLEKSPELDIGDAYVNDIAVVPTGKSGERALVLMLSDGGKTPGAVRSFLVRRGPLDKPGA